VLLGWLPGNRNRHSLVTRVTSRTAISSHHLPSTVTHVVTGLPATRTFDLNAYWANDLGAEAD